MAVGTQHGQITKRRLSFAVVAAQRLAMVYLAEIFHGGAEDLFEVEVTGFAAELSGVGFHLAFLPLYEGLIALSSEVSVPPLFSLAARHENAIVHVGEPFAIS